MTEHLTLKWGTLKSWCVESSAAVAALEAYVAAGMSMSAAAQADTREQKAAICAMIDVMAIPYVLNDWTGAEMSKEEARAYVMNYGNNP